MGDQPQNHSQQPPADRLPTWTEWSISVLNGVLGDYLRDRQNALAIEMAFYQQNRPLAITTASLSQAHPAHTPKLCILVHGLGCNEGVWAFRDEAQGATSYGSLLQQDLGYTPFYLRYNTGLPVADNGKRLATLLDELLVGYPAHVAEIVLIGHSMGGLVLRSACHYGVERQSVWVNKVNQSFYLGTPHQGADLEKLGHVTTLALQAVPNPITRLIGAILNLRSQGVKDLRSGKLLAEDRLNEAADTDSGAVPWLENARHHLIFGTLTKDPLHPTARLFGDALVRPAPKPAHSAQGDGGATMASVNMKLLPQIHHLGLAHDPAVYQLIHSACRCE